VSHHLLMRVLGALGNKEAQCSAIDAIKFSVALFDLKTRCPPFSCWAWNEGASVDIGAPRLTRATNLRNGGELPASRKDEH
jgi:hypothetical protein